MRNLIESEAMKKFYYQIEVEEIPYSPYTVEQLFGKGAKYNPDYSEDCIARETICDLIKDAIISVLKSKMDFISRKKCDSDKLVGPDKQMWDYFCEKEARYRKIESTIKPLLESGV